MRPLLLIIGAVAVAGALLFGVTAALTKPLPDLNRVDARDVTVGYADIQITLTLRENCQVADATLGTQVCTAAAQNMRMSTTEVLSQPTSLATFVDWPKATIGTSCTSYVTITASGPGLAAVVTGQSINKNVAVGETETYPFGHIHFMALGTTTVAVELFAWKCYGLESPTSIFSLTRTFDFDGVNDS